MHRLTAKAPSRRDLVLAAISGIYPRRAAAIAPIHVRTTGADMALLCRPEWLRRMSIECLLVMRALTECEVAPRVACATRVWGLARGGEANSGQVCLGRGTHLR